MKIHWGGLMNKITSRDRSKRRAVGASACSKLIRQALNEMLKVADQEQALSAGDTRPCIEKESLRRLGIAASDPVVEMMTWWPRTQLLLLLEYDRQTVDGETPLDAIPAKLLDVFAKSLGRAYWAARNCTEPAKFEKLSHELLSRSLRKLNEPIVEQAISLDRLMAIDLSKYDDLVTYTTDRDWPRERKKIRFLQTAVRLGYDPALVVKLTGGFFGKALKTPFRLFQGGSYVR